MPAATTATRAGFGGWDEVEKSGIFWRWRMPPILFAFTGKSLY
jgi:hypothetical protein